MRSMNSDGIVEVKLNISKSRVAPMNPSTIPRLELCGALRNISIARQENSR